MYTVNGFRDKEWLLGSEFEGITSDVPGGLYVQRQDISGTIKDTDLSALCTSFEF